MDSPNCSRAGSLLQKVSVYGLPFLCWTMLVVYFFCYYCQSVKYTIWFGQWLSDGAFQILNPVRRIDAGQRGGVDFQFFHGLALPYVHYPFYKLFGGGLHGSELARYLVSFVAYLGAFGTIFYVVTRRFSSTVLLIALALPIGESLDFYDLVVPGNSLIGLRSTMPILLLAVLLAGFERRRESLLFGIGLGIAFVLGTEQGIACILATVGVHALLMVMGDDWKGTLRSLVFRLGAAAATAVSFFLLVGGVRGLAGALHYNLIAVPQDQFWYFGAPPNLFFSEYWQIFAFHKFYYTVTIAVASLAAALWCYHRRRGAADAPELPYVWALAYGVFTLSSCFGMAAVHYLLPLQRMLLILGLIGAWKLVARLKPESELRGPLRVAGVVVLLVMLIGGPIHQDRMPSGCACWPRTVGESFYFTVRVVTGDWRTMHEAHTEHMQQMTAAIDEDLAREPRELKIWSTYSGLLEDHYQIFHPDRDYVIQALGKGGREDYLEAFRRADTPFAYTLRKRYFRYEEWLQNTTWPFYEELILNYDPICTSFAAILWKRKPGAWHRAGEFKESFIPEDRGEFTVPLPREMRPGTLLVVKVEYTIRNHLAPVPVLGQLPRYLLHPKYCLNETPISLCPYEKNLEFAVMPKGNEAPVFQIVTESLVGGSAKIDRVWVRPLPIDPYLYPEISQNTTEFNLPYGRWKECTYDPWDQKDERSSRHSK